MTGQAALPHRNIHILLNICLVLYERYREGGVRRDQEILIGGRWTLMGQPSSKKNKTTIRYQFDRLCQKILHDEKVDYIREQEYRRFLW